MKFKDFVLPEHNVTRINAYLREISFYILWHRVIDLMATEISYVDP